MDNEYLKQIYGLLESGATLGTGAVSGLVGVPYGLYKGVTSGAYGTSQAPRIAAREAQQFMERNTYQPRTAEGQENIRQLAGLLEATKLPPVMPEVSLLAAIPKQAYAAQAERAGMAAERAVAPVVTRTMERGGLPAQLLGDLSQGSIRPMDVWHGSAHGPFSSFDSTKIGTGEGAQAFSHGHYTAEAKPVASEYQQMLSRKEGLQSQIGNQSLADFYSKIENNANKLSPEKAGVEYEKLAFLEDLELQPSFNDAFKRIDNEEILPWAESLRDKYKPAGYLYKVDLPDESIAQMMDWDKPLSQQSKYVQDALNRSDIADIWKSKIGHDIEKSKPQADMVYKTLVDHFGNDAAASQYLKDLGIPGMRYLDQGSRNVSQNWVVNVPEFGSYDFPTKNDAQAFMKDFAKSDPQYKAELIEPSPVTSNFVVFPGNENLLTIKEINDKPVGGLLSESAPAQATNLSDIENKFKDVTLDVYEKNGTINLSRIVVPKDMRSSGVGSSVMNDLTAYADQTGQKMALTPSSDFGGNVSRLKNFYKQFGFVENKGKNKDFSTMESMIRPAQNSPNERYLTNLLD